jgi:serine protease Do
LPRPMGALVAGISAGGPATLAGFAQGDVILSVAGHTIATMRDLPFVVADLPIGRPADVTVWRRNREITLRPIIGEMPQSPEVADVAPAEREADRPGPSDLTAGLKLASLTAQRRRQLQIPSDVGGAIVTAIGDDSPLAVADLLPGDVIESVDQQPVTTPNEVFTRLAAAATGGGSAVVMLIDRHGASHFVALPLKNDPAGGQKG